MAPRIIGYPPDPLGDPANYGLRAEKMVYDKLVQLPDDWLVGCGLATLFWSEGLHRKAYLRDREADFLIFAPGKGMILVEVKGYREYRAVAAKWERKDSQTGLWLPMIESPFQQAANCQHGVEQSLCGKLGLTQLPGAKGRLVVFPNGVRDGTLPDLAAGEIVVDADSFGQLCEIIRHAFDNWVGGNIQSLFTNEHVTAIETLFSGTCVRDAPEERARICMENLTASQHKAVGGILGKNSRILIEGPAGSGKTIIAGWIVKKAGTKGLFLCYNQSLANWVISSAETGKAEVKRFISYAMSLCGKANISLVLPQAQQELDRFYAEDLPLSVLAARDILKSRGLWPSYDVIAVDEGQDFRKGWWSIVCSFLAPGGKLVIFMDPRQRLYGQRVGDIDGCGIPDNMGCAVYELQENCRNTQAVALYSGKPINAEITAKFGALSGTSPEITAVCDTPEKLLEIAQTTIKKWKAGGARRIAVLTPVKFEASALANVQSVDAYPILKIGGVTGVGDDKRDRHTLKTWRDIGGVLHSTIHSFKGMEAPYVLILGVNISNALNKSGVIEENSADTSSKMLYVAFSRSMNHLVVVPSTKRTQDKLIEWLK